MNVYVHQQPREVAGLALPICKPRKIIKMMTLTKVNKVSSPAEYDALAEERVAFRSGYGRDTAAHLPLAERSKGKVFRVRRLLAAGTYDVEKRLDAVLDKVLQSIHA
jgi:hypothetical protein